MNIRKKNLHHGYTCCNVGCNDGPCPCGQLLVADVGEFPNEDLHNEALDAVDEINARLERLAVSLRDHDFSLALFVEELAVTPERDDDPTTLDVPVLHPIRLTPPPPISPDDDGGEGDLKPVDVTDVAIRLLPPNR